MNKFAVLRSAVNDYADTYDACVVNRGASEETWAKHRAACALLGIKGSHMNEYAYIPRHLLTLIKAALDYAEMVDNFGAAIEEVKETIW